MATSNQIAYWNYRETKRANEAKEQLGLDTLAETHRSNLAHETETSRSNKAKERETTRSNLARERETNRTNLANEAIGIARNEETKRSNLRNEEISEAHNIVTEDETARHNKKMEAYQYMSSGAQATNAQTQQKLAKYQQRYYDAQIAHMKGDTFTDIYGTVGKDLIGIISGPVAGVPRRPVGYGLN